MAKVVMLTAMAGAGLDLAYGDVFETDETEAARFLEHQAAREFDPKLDSNKPVKSRGQEEPIAEGHFQSDSKKSKKGKKQTTGQSAGSEESSEDAASNPDAIAEQSGPIDAEAEESAPTEQKPRPRRR